MRALRSSLIAGALLSAVACSESVSPEPLGDYEAWPAMGGATYTVSGKAPGHGDTIRVIYVNPTAANAESISPSYPTGSTIVKEIRENENGVAGEIRYVAIMRREDTIVTEGLADEGGWLFSEQRPKDAPEVYFGFCWARCHAAAAYNGAFYDYRTK
jgi:hypothetical protein